MNPVVPIVLFAYARPSHLARVLACLKENNVPLIYAFCDGAKGAADGAAVAEVRALLRAVDWTEVRLTERTHNLGLGRNVLGGVTEVAEQHEAFIVWEDDLICVAGTYDWLCAALRHYAGEERVMSVAAWTHPRVTPPAVGDQPYFDARAECWVWGGYARSWRGMEMSAPNKMAAAAERGIGPAAYGSDLPRMARDEARKNIWAVRWLYHHLQYGGLCLRPPWSMVEHIGFDPGATNAGAAMGWENPVLRHVPPIPAIWPGVVEHAECRRLWRTATVESGQGAISRLKRVVRRVVPRNWLAPVERRFFRVWWEGVYSDWAAASADCSGYDAPAIIAKVVAAARLVRDGRATYERDGVAFHQPAPWWPGLKVLQDAARARGGALTVLDFGGSLGSLYFQNRRQLQIAGPLRWRVIELLALVKLGQQEFQSEELEFYASVSGACADTVPDVLLLGSVMPYLPDPLEILAGLLRTGATHVVIERTGFVTEGRARLTVQRVPRSIYPARYPCWFLNRGDLLSTIGSAYRLVHECRDAIETPTGLEFRTLHFVKVDR